MATKVWLIVFEQSNEIIGIYDTFESATKACKDLRYASSIREDIPWIVVKEFDLNDVTESFKTTLKETIEMYNDQLTILKAFST